MSRSHADAVRAPRPADRILDPLLVAAVSGAVFALHGYDGQLTRDLGAFTYGGERVAHGVPPYVGLFNSVGPLSDLVPGLAIALGRVVGIGPVLAERVFFTVLSAACCALLSVLARDAFRSRAAGWVVPAVFLTFGEFLALASGGPREKTTMVLFLLASLILLGRRRWLAAGACCALATLAWQPVLVVVLTAAVVSVLTAAGGRVRATIGFVAGGLIPTALAVVGFAATGHLRTAVDGFVVVNAVDTQQPSFWEDPGGTLAFLLRGYHDSLAIAGVGLLALGTLGVLRMARRRADQVLTLAVAGVAAVGWSSFAMNGSPDLFVVLPFAALGLGGAVVAVARRLPALPAGALVATATAAAVVFGASEAITRHNDYLVEQRADVSDVLAAAPPHATMLSLDAPEALALAGRTNPTPYQIFDEAMKGFLDHHYPGGLTGYAQHVADLHPTLIVTSTRGLPSWARPELRPLYRCAGVGPQWVWYVARSAGPAATAAVQDANRLALTHAV